MPLGVLYLAALIFVLVVQRFPVRSPSQYVIVIFGLNIGSIVKTRDCSRSPTQPNCYKLYQI